MTALRLFALSDGDIGAEELTFSKAHLEGDIDPTSYRLRASGNIPAIPDRPFIPADEVRGLVLGDIGDDALAALGSDGRLLFVASGWLELVRPAEVPIRFARGSLLLAEPSVPLDGFIAHENGTKIVAFHLADQWPVEGTPLHRNEGGDAATPDLIIRSMRQAHDGTSYFASFEQLFQDEAGSAGQPRPIRGIYFAEAQDGTVIGMHPEVQCNLVLVLAGDLELEVGGEGAIEHFRIGDVVLAADRTGEGHIDRFRGTTTLLAASMAEDDPWPVVQDAR